MAGRGGTRVARRLPGEGKERDELVGEVLVHIGPGGVDGEEGIHRLVGHTLRVRPRALPFWPAGPALQFAGSDPNAAEPGAAGPPGVRQEYQRARAARRRVLLHDDPGVEPGLREPLER